MTYPEPRSEKHRRRPIPSTDAFLGFFIGTYVVFMIMLVISHRAYNRLTDTVCVGLGWDSGYAEDSYKGYCVRGTNTEKYECALPMVMKGECELWNADD